MTNETVLISLFALPVISLFIGYVSVELVKRINLRFTTLA
ncbi:hypothetical protein PCIT_a0634 [Pseudoalteromonas citrea]|uniref:Uncharacterized protein n=1 Tax=Pseudoalteromonas citrea TaxID=43655 RepID=A0AAD4AKZ1_9GAMM|nr:hypothetical protein PCIT_a0634 [Pseudoalteromonas citrea]